MISCLHTPVIMINLDVEPPLTETKTKLSKGRKASN
jgi:hypothetical protein